MTFQPLWILAQNSSKLYQIVKIVQVVPNTGAKYDVQIKLCFKYMLFRIKYFLRHYFDYFHQTLKWQNLTRFHLIRLLYQKQNSNAAESDWFFDLFFKSDTIYVFRELFFAREIQTAFTICCPKDDEKVPGYAGDVRDIVSAVSRILSVSQNNITFLSFLCLTDKRVFVKAAGVFFTECNVGILHVFGSLKFLF
jgi:hypothetical protein